MFLSSTARLTAAVPFQVLSDGLYVYVLRQAIVDPSAAVLDAAHAVLTNPSAAPADVACRRRRRHRPRADGLRAGRRRPARARPERSADPARRRHAPRGPLRARRRPAPAEARGQVPAQPEQVPAAVEQGQLGRLRSRRPSVRGADARAAVRARPEQGAVQRLARPDPGRRRLQMAALRRPRQRRARVVVQHRALRRRPLQHARNPGLHVRRSPRRLCPGHGHVPGAQHRRPDAGLRQAPRPSRRHGGRRRQRAVLQRRRRSRLAHGQREHQRRVHPRSVDRRRLGGARRPRPAPPRRSPPPTRLTLVRRCGYRGGTKVVVGFGDGAAFHQATSGDVLTPGWHHLAVVFDGSLLQVHVDGGLAFGSTDLSGVVPVAAPIGLLGAPTNGFAGVLDEVRASGRSPGASPTSGLDASAPHRARAGPRQLPPPRRVPRPDDLRSHRQRHDRHDRGRARGWRQTRPIAESVGIARSALRLDGRSVVGWTARRRCITSRRTPSAGTQAPRPLRSSRLRASMLAAVTSETAGTATAAGTPPSTMVAIDFGVAVDGTLAQAPPANSRSPNSTCQVAVRGYRRSTPCWPRCFLAPRADCCRA